MASVNGGAMGVLRILACLSAVIHFLAFLSPQVGQLGRGLRTGLPAFVLACLFIAVADLGAIFRALHRLRGMLLLGSIFIVQSGLRLATIEAYYWRALLDAFVLGPMQLLAAVVLFASLRELGHVCVRLFTLLLIGGWCVSLSLGVPHLNAKPKIARELMGGDPAATYAAQKEWSPRGVGSYGDYTSAAVCTVALGAAAAKLGRWWRWVLFPPISGAFLAVGLSTFTMATALLVVGGLALAMYWAFHRRSLRGPRVILVLVLTVVVPGLLGSAAASTKHFSFVYEKMGRLIEHVSEIGFEQGDFTGRASMFAHEMRAFVENPILGSIGGITRVETGQGHSSLSNMLVTHGIIGAVWWFGFLFLLFRHGWRACDLSIDRYVVAVSAGLLFASGILNPTWHRVSTVGPMIVLLWALPILRQREYLRPHHMPGTPRRWPEEITSPLRQFPDGV